MKITYIHILVFLLAFAQACSAIPESAAIAFPGAEGAGKYTSGGRGGDVLIVTNLNDNGPGSLREAIDRKGARTIVFEISGTIELESPLVIEDGDLTIAGQSAPGQGICLKGYPLGFEDGNVIIRYVRFRLGNISGQSADAINCKNQDNVIIDHCSMSWSVDETGSFYDNTNFTLQWCIISESLNNSVHKKGRHGYGGIWGGMNATFHHNLLAHHTSRNPRFQGSRYHQMPDKEKSDFVNNVIYNWGFKCAYGGEKGSYNLVNNYFKPGPATKKSQRKSILEPFRPYGNFFLKGNVLEGDEVFSADNWSGVEINVEAIDSVRALSRIAVNPQLMEESALEAYQKVLASAGASFFRDETDQRIIKEVASGTAECGVNGIINTQDEAGGWPDLQSLPAPMDTDRDGMPDEWEASHKLDIQDASDRNAYSIDEHYTNLEVYLNRLLEKKLP